MAARLNPRHQEMVRAKIQTSQLIRVLQEEGMGKTELRDGQRESAKFLINKSMSNPPTIVAGPGTEGQHKIEMTLSFR
jgi:hypothetical protein